MNIKLLLFWSMQKMKITCRESLKRVLIGYVFYEKNCQTKKKHWRIDVQITETRFMVTKKSAAVNTTFLPAQGQGHT